MTKSIQRFRSAGVILIPLALAAPCAQAQQAQQAADQGLEEEIGRASCRERVYGLV